ncbi:hypothetical protein A6587_24280 [Escherichia coli]|nr:hypothetical protein A6587_24280 [Escherichia coli]HAH2679490.1 hypothetical protein [Escherichia coli]
MPESGSALPGQHRFLPVHVQIVGCGVNALSDLHSRRPDKTRNELNPKTWTVSVNRLFDTQSGILPG